MSKLIVQFVINIIFCRSEFIALFMGNLDYIGVYDTNLHVCDMADADGYLLCCLMSSRLPNLSESILMIKFLEI